MANDDDDDMIRELVWVAQPVNKAVYAVEVAYEEGDAINAVGQIIRFTKDKSTILADGSLNTNDGLANIWASPQGNLWVGSTDGNVWTTADVKWDTSKIPNVVWEEADPDFKWKGTAVPLSHDGTPCNVAVMEGSSDHDVFAGTFDGDILRWDGKQWSVSYAESNKPIQRMHSTGPDDIWAVGRNSQVLHFDGHHWRVVPLPGDEGDENLTGVYALSKDEVYICSTSGAIFHGSRHGLERLGDYQQGFYAIVEYKGAMYLAAGDGGVCTLSGNKLNVIKKTFSAVGIYRLPERLALTMADKRDRPTFVMHDPGNQPPWATWSA